ncbi:Polysaccharide export protein [Nitrobacter winogradskyi Nb-255]|uniref:Polysaccharide export protein n=1 Tax=Nitrobacter winogradskyi (strain ATCC 25391 / DSM 10237 / CIP 104748 / NCIMB 11846 / Nb-255) TaxID=323098 RepID=Q3SSR6_NITWN|nr:polysaccharide biosynthesis/export family protein [Nitrobacter winogradskyi]ABA04675.1 Polysaccharide export protein [Nitrobacter winogradskyi Nb-255]
MRNLRAVTLGLLTTLALSGCMQHPAPAVMVRPHNDLDAMAYAGPKAPAPVPRRRGLWHTPAFTTAAAPVVYAAAPPPPVIHDPAYRLDAGDRLRIVVYGQEGLTNTYLVDAGGSITMPLIGAVTARGRTPAELSATIAARLRNGYIRQPYVAVEIEAYRPFFILGEVAAPGQYPFVPNMTVESAVAIAGGFSPRARRDRVIVTHTDDRGTVRLMLPPVAPLSPGDTVVVDERWF